MNDVRAELRGVRAAVVMPAPLGQSQRQNEVISLLRPLAAAGARIDLYLEVPGYLSPASLQQLCLRRWGTHPFQIFPKPQVKGEYDLVLAAGWRCARIVQGNRRQLQAFLVQDLELMGGAAEDWRTIAAQSCAAGSSPIALGRWVAYRLKLELGLDAFSVPFCAETAVEPRVGLRRRLAICVLKRENLPAAGRRLQKEALNAINARFPKIEIVWTDRGVGCAELDAMLKDCQLALCFGTGNPSSALFQCLAGGVPLINLYRENNLFDLPDAGCLLAYATPASIVEAVGLVLESEFNQSSLSRAAADYMRSRSESVRNEEFQRALLGIISEQRPAEQGRDFIRSYQGQPVVAEADQSAGVRHYCDFQFGQARAVEPWCIDRRLGELNGRALGARCAD